MGNRLIELLSAWAVEKRKAILALSLLFAILCALGLPRLRTDSSPDALVSSVAGQAESVEAFQKHFPSSEQQLVILIEGKDVTTRPALNFQARLRSRLQEEKNVVRVDGTVESVLETEEEATAARKHLLEAPGVTPLLLSEDRTLAALIVHLDDKKVFDQDTRMAALKKARQIVAAEETPSGFEVRFGGVPVLGEAILKKLEKDRFTLNPAMMILCLIILGATFHWWPAMVAPLLAVGLAALAVVGGMGLLDKPLTILTNIIPALLIIVGLSDSVHLLGRYFEELQVDSDRVRAGRRAARAMLVACFLTSLTTAVGFVSLVTAHTEELRRFGLAAAAGVMVAYFATVLFVPAFVTLVKSPKKFQQPAHASRENRSSPSRLERFVFLLTFYVMRHARSVTIVSAFVGVALGWAASRVGTDARLLDAFDRDEPVAQDTYLLEEKLAGIRPMEVLLSSKGASWEDEAVQKRLKDIQKWLEGETGVIATLSYADFPLPSQEDMVAPPEDEQHVAVPAARETRNLARGVIAEQGAAQRAAAERAAFEQREAMRREMLARQEAALTRAKKQRRSWLAEDGRHARLAVYFSDVGIRRTLVLIDELERRLLGLPVEGVGVRFLGEAYTGSVGRDFVLQDLVSGLGLAVGIILLLLIALFRSLRLGLVSLPPNLLPLLGTAAYMMARGIQLNLATVITFSIGIGLAVDDSVHVVSRFLEERRQISSIRVALLRACRGTGRAIVVTAISLVCGFGVLLASEFAPVRQFGELIAVTVINCLVAALVVQPALLILVLKKPQHALRSSK